MGHMSDGFNNKYRIQSQGIVYKVSVHGRFLSFPIDIDVGYWATADTKTNQQASYLRSPQLLGTLGAVFDCAAVLLGSVRSGTGLWVYQTLECVSICSV